ncbi:hypothetical protein [Rubinisphaera margarita]|uniref:hypothetical protein n=1 Tax=Rubinisphaera margarita TaxID=2909586 RepID=UPI001EE93A47|nr:hypothetical protein [Rubinisphaera margarita]MCG6155318.1 hypothetical protein [Rubinisphaera margarita]
MSTPLAESTPAAAFATRPGVWWLVFFSPLLSFLTLALAGWARLPELAVQAALIATLLSPLAAIVYCLPVIWSRYRGSGSRAVGLTAVLLGILLQFAFVLVILAAVVTAMISYAQ